MKWFINLKIGVKLISSFIIIAIIAGIVGTMGIIELKKVRHEYSELFSSYGNGQGYIAEVYTGFLRQRLAIRDIFIFTDKKSRDTKFAKIAAMDLVIKKGLDDYDKTCILEEDFAQIIILRESLTNYRKRLSDIEDLLSQNEEKVAYDLFKDSLGSGAKVDEQMDKILTFNMEEGQKISNLLDISVKKTVYVLIFFVMSSMVLAIVIGLFITSLINTPIKKITAISKKLALGSTDLEIDINRTDEIGLLANTFKQIIEVTKAQASLIAKIAKGDMTSSIEIRSEEDIVNQNLQLVINKNNHLFGEIRRVASQVNLASTQVAQGSTMLAQASSEQAATVEEITCTVSSIANQAKENASGARTVNVLAGEAKLSAKTGTLQMENMINSMSDINEASKNISKIIKVIDDIAFQTNILALNAAVEAARAGNHGKGFAVVAEEVRNLAARSAKAANETTDLIESTINKVNNGANIASETAEALNVIYARIDKVTEMIGEIATSSGEQASAVSQVSQGMSQISESVQTNSATAEESAAASEELSAQAESLKESVACFILKDSI